jgi:hypothetical protein
MDEVSDEAGLFAGANGVDEVLAIILDQYGPEGLQEFLAMVVAGADVTREMLERAAELMEDAGLSEAAEMVFDAAGDIPPKSQQNPFDAIAERALHIDWNRRELGNWSGFMFTDEERIAKGRAMGLIK